jgi:hypothetical protein
MYVRNHSLIRAVSMSTSVYMLCATSVTNNSAVSVHAYVSSADNLQKCSVYS